MIRSDQAGRACQAVEGVDLEEEGPRTHSEALVVTTSFEEISCHWASLLCCIARVGAGKGAQSWHKLRA